MKIGTALKMHESRLKKHLKKGKKKSVRAAAIPIAKMHFSVSFAAPHLPKMSKRAISSLTKIKVLQTTVMLKCPMLHLILWEELPPLKK